MPPNASRPVFVGNSHTPLCKLLMLRRLISVPPTREAKRTLSLRSACVSSHLFTEGLLCAAYSYRCGKLYRLPSF